jgi:hypothetical protein
MSHSNDDEHLKFLKCDLQKLGEGKNAATAQQSGVGTTREGKPHQKTIYYRQKLIEYSLGNIEIIHLKRPTLLRSRLYVSLSLSSTCVVTDTDKKENQIFLVFKEI